MQQQENTVEQVEDNKPSFLKSHNLELISKSICQFLTIEVL